MHLNASQALIFKDGDGGAPLPSSCPHVAREALALAGLAACRKGIAMPMDALTLKAFESLVRKILPALSDALQRLEGRPAAERQADPALLYLLDEGVALLSMLRTWAGAPTTASAPASSPSPQLPTPSALSELLALDPSLLGDDEDAASLLADMQGLTSAPTKHAAMDEAMSDAEAQRLLAAMDGDDDAAAATDQAVPMSDDLAQKLLAQMDSPLTPPAESMSDAEARRLLEQMDAAAPTAGSNDDDDLSAHDAAALMAQMDEPSNSPQAAAVLPVFALAGEALEVVGEIAEFGESEFGSDPDMIRDFINNADELMESLDTQILSLEQEPERTEIIEEIFRAAHTLKGAAGMFAFQAIERVMHRMENYFDQLRKGKRRADGDGIDVILRAMDVLRTLIGGVREGKPSGCKTAPIVEDLNALCSGVYRGSKPLAAGSGAGHDAGNHPSPTPGAEAEREGGSAGSRSRKVEQSTIRVDLQRLDALVNLVGELVIDRTRFLSIEEQLRMKGPHPALASNMTETVQLYGRHMNEVQDIIMKIRMVPIGNAFNKFPRVVRDLAKSLNKEIDLLIDGETTELDKTLVEQIGDPLVHLIRNAVDHGIEMPADRLARGKDTRGKVILAARQEGNQIIITIEDDGRGLHKDKLRQKGIDRGLISEDDNLSDRDIFNLIFEAGFSTAEKVTNISGRGVGMDVVKKQISKLKGIIDISSTQDRGTLISIQLPLTLAIVQSLLVQTRNEVFAIPLSAVVESLRIRPSEIQRVGEAEVIKRRNMVLPLLYLHEALDLDRRAEHLWYNDTATLSPNHSRGRQRRIDERLYVVVVGNAERRFGIVVDNLLNQQEMVIKTMGHMMQDIACVAGGAILGNGEVVLVLDIAELEEHFRNKGRQQAA